MSSLSLKGDGGNSLVALSNNLKVNLAAALFQPKLNVTIDDDESTLSLRDVKSGFEVREANAIVRYLANDFSASKEVECEETKLYKALKANKKEVLVDAMSQDSTSFGEASATAAQIIVFSSLYAGLKDDKETIAKPDWFSDFSRLPQVEEAVAKATALVKLDRPKAQNTGVQKVKTGHLVKKQDAEIKPKKGERNILITSSLPYVNNVPHLGNIIGSVLSADIYARYAKSRNYNSLYICGTDEYGTATETKALEEKVTPQELCNKYYKIHKQVYDWFDIKFDYFGRTTTPKQTEIAQDIFMDLYNNGYLEEKTTEQLYCEEHRSFLADRFVEGTCPKCGYDDARGDQCDKCGGLLNPFELINPRCKLDNSKPVLRESTHIYIKLNELEPELKQWIEKASDKGAWSKNTRTITNSWVKQGLEPRCITRDLKWGTAVPLASYKDKVLYVWFDAPIGYVSITANYFSNKDADEWKEWWLNPENVDLYQFMGKDNVPFHTVVFPASQIGTKKNWTKIHHISTTEYLQYESGKFSKSRGIGVFGNNAKDSGIPPAVWRYYLTSVRPETSDSHFSWAEFVTKNNSELLANLGNFVNRLVKFAIAKYNGVVPDYDATKIANYEGFTSDVNSLLAQYNESMEAVGLRKGLELAMFISARGNQFLQDNKLDNTLYAEQPAKSDAVVAVGLNLIYLVGALVGPFMPETATQIFQILNAPPLSITNTFEYVLEPGHCIGKAQYLFKRIDEKKIEEWRNLYGGKQVK